VLLCLEQLTKLLLPAAFLRASAVLVHLNLLLQRAKARPPHIDISFGSLGLLLVQIYSGSVISLCSLLLRIRSIKLVLFLVASGCALILGIRCSDLLLLALRQPCQVLGLRLRRIIYNVDLVLDNNLCLVRIIAHIVVLRLVAVAGSIAPRPLIDLLLRCYFSVLLAAPLRLNCVTCRCLRLMVDRA